MLKKGTVRTLMKEAGAERLSEDAILEMKNRLETYIESVVTKAKDMAAHAGRKTIKDEDIILAEEGL